MHKRQGASGLSDPKAGRSAGADNSGVIEPGDLVLDPFCGCGTTIHAAQKLGRAWIGIDITHLAISLIERRLKDAFPGVMFEVHGTPKDLESAIDLARRDKYQFQWWAVSLVDARPYGGKKKGADGGIDGILFFRSDKDKTEKALISVKGGDNVGVGMVRELIAVVEREKAAVGVLISLGLPTRAMEREAAAAGFFEIAVRSGAENPDHHPGRTVSRRPAAHPAHRFRPRPSAPPPASGPTRRGSCSERLNKMKFIAPTIYRRLRGRVCDEVDERLGQLDASFETAALRPPQDEDFS